MSESPTDPAAGAVCSEEVVQRFLDYPLFHDLNRAQVAEFLSHCQELQLDAGEVLIREGDEDQNLFFLSNGEVEVYCTDAEGDEHTVAALPAPGVVGEVEFLTREPRAASVRTTTAVDGLVIDGLRLKQELEAGNQVTARVLFYMARVLARRLAAMNRKFVELDQQAPGTRFDELRDFQQRLMSEWTV